MQPSRTSEICSFNVTLSPCFVSLLSLHWHYLHVFTASCSALLQVAARKELDFRISELQDLVMEKETELEAQQLDFDRKRLVSETKHSEMTDWLFRITCASRATVT